MDDLTGQTIRGYELRAQLGAGGFGAVYRAYQAMVKREVAVKVILPELANQPDFVRRFEAEAQLVARLEHPHIVPLYDYWREPSGAYLVMRLLRGGSLRELLDKGEWDNANLMQTVEQISSALTTSHNNGVIHRDLKPDNILFDEEGNAYLADFGIAKDLQNITDGEKNEDEGLVGSVAYISPEQIKGQTVGPQTDVYCMGMMLYELVTGKTPFYGVPLSLALHKHLYEPVPDLRESHPELPDDLNIVIQRATQKNPEDRYGSMREMVQDFRRAMANAVSMGKAEFAGLDASRDSTINISSGELVAINPYKGLRAFQEGDANDFFGREKLVDRLIKRMEDPEAGSRFLAVVGPSGSGKSSAVKAGVLPELRQGMIPGSQDWFIVEIVPNAHPMHELEEALLSISVTPPDNLHDQLNGDKNGLLQAVNRIVPPSDELLVVIDQFEETFTQVEDEAERAHLLNSLLAATTDPGSRLRVIVTLRADFYDRPLLYPTFGELMRSRTEIVLPMTNEELTRAIVEPARRAGLALEPGLVTSIVAEIGEQPGALPLLQYALTELFERRDGNVLTLDAYNQMGGVSGALAQRATELYEGLDDEGKKTARQMLLRLVNTGEGVEDTRRRVRLPDLLSLKGNEEMMSRVVDLFGRYRLLTFDRDPITRVPTVEVAHEALIRQWSLLRQWLTTSREDLLLEARLAASSEEWLKSNRDSGFLASGTRLEQLENWSKETELALTELEAEYLQASLAKREEERAEEAARQAHEKYLERRSRAFLRVLVVVMALGLIVAGVLWRSSEAAKEEAQRQSLLAERQRQIAHVGELTAHSRQLLNNTPPTLDLALLIAREADWAEDDLPDYSLPAIHSVLLDGVDMNPLDFSYLHFHTERLEALVFSPNNQFMASFDDPGNLVLWDVQTRRIVLQFSARDYGVHSVTFSPDSQRVAFGIWDGTVYIWDIAANKQLTKMRPNTVDTRSVEHLGYSPDGKYLLTSTSGGAVALWNVAAPDQAPQTLTTGTDVVPKFIFSTDGKRLAISGGEHQIDLWDMTRLTRIGQVSEQIAEIRSMAFNNSGDRLATGGLDGTVILWSVPDFTRVATMNAHQPRSVEVLGFDAKDETLLSESRDGKVIRWNAADGSLLKVERPSDNQTNVEAFSPDGTRLAAGNADNTVTLSDLQGEVALEGHPTLVNLLTFSPDNNWLASGSLDGTIVLWNVQNRLHFPMSGHQDVVTTVAFSPDNQLVATGSFDHTVILWDTTTHKRVAILSGHQDAVTDIAFSPDGKTLASASWDDTIILWDVATHKARMTLTGHTNWVNSLAFSPDGKTLASGSNDRNVVLWDVATGKARFTLIGHIGWVKRVVFSPDGKTLASASADDTVILWDTASGKSRAVLSQAGGSIEALSFSPDGALLATAGSAGTVVLWNVASGQRSANLDVTPDQPAQGAVSTLAFSPNGRWLVSGGADGEPIVWDVAGQTVFARLKDRGANVNVAVFSPDSTFLAIGTWDSSVSVWQVDADNHELISRLDEQRGAINALAFSPNGALLASGSDDGSLMLWDMSPESWVSRACRIANRDLTSDEWNQYMGSQAYHETCPANPGENAEGDDAGRYPEATPAAVPVVTSEPTTVPTPEVTSVVPTVAHPEATTEATAAVTPEVTPQVTPEATPEVTPAP